MNMEILHGDQLDRGLQYLGASQRSLNRYARCSVLQVEIQFENNRSEHRSLTTIYQSRSANYSVCSRGTLREVGGISVSLLRRLSRSKTGKNEVNTVKTISTILSLVSSIISSIQMKHTSTIRHRLRVEYFESKGREINQRISKRGHRLRVSGFTLPHGALLEVSRTI